MVVRESAENRARTKIVATVGPACDDVPTLTEMIRAGMNVARLNFSHEDHASHRQRLARVREAAATASARVATMLDTKGAEVRTGSIEDGVSLESLLLAHARGEKEAQTEPLATSVEAELLSFLP